MSGVNLAEALKLVNEAGRERAFALSYHADAEKLPLLGLSPADVQSALEGADDGVPDDDSGVKWKVYGPIVSGEVVAVVVRFRADRPPLVVTVHPFP
jgi:hypothetical protein